MFDAPIKEAQWIHSSRQGVACSILHRPRCDYLAHAVRLQRTHHARALHLLDHARRAVVTDLEPALHAGDGGAARLGDDLHGLIVQRVALGVAAVFAGIAAPAFAAIETLTVQYLVEIIRLALDLELLDDLVHLLIGDEGAMHAHGHAGAGRKIEHVAVTEQVFRALLGEDGARIDTRRDLEGDARRDVALIKPVMTSTDGRCVASTRWMPEARAFCASRAMSSSTFLPTSIIMSASSSITTTI